MKTETQERCSSWIWHSKLSIDSLDMRILGRIVGVHSTEQFVGIKFGAFDLDIIISLYVNNWHITPHNGLPAHCFPDHRFPDLHPSK